MPDNKLVEVIADFMHEQWSHWMKYQFSQMKWRSDDLFSMDINQFHHWKRQMEIPYAELSEKEKDSDREWAIKLLEEFWKNDIVVTDLSK